MIFDRPVLLPLALLLPVITVLLLHLAHRHRQRRIERLGAPDVVRRILPPAALVGPRWRMARLGLAAALAGVAVAGPRWGQEAAVVRSQGIDMVLALDASLSMMATDERPHRLERMKQEVRRLRALSPGDRVALLAFAGRSYILSPLTVDDGALDLFLDNLDPSVVGQAGSSLARTIRQGVDLLGLSTSGADRAIVVMSDGEAHEPMDEVVAEARRAAAQGISVVTVGFGTVQGSTIPVRTPEGITMKRDENGQIVVTRYEPEYLQAAADAARGTFIPADATDKAARVRAAVATLRTEARTTAARANLIPRFQYFLFPAVLLLLLDTMLGERSRRRPAAPAAARVATAALLFLFVGACAGTARTRDAARAYERGAFAEASTAFREAIDRGDRRPETLYNYGTALLAGDSLAAAAEVLERVRDGGDEIRHRALFNRGLAHLKRGLIPGSPQADAELDAALALYKQVLLTHPEDDDARWNYELALRTRQAGGGGGGGGGDAQQPQPDPRDQQQQQPSGGLGQSQAEQLLNNAARDEREVQARQQRDRRVEPPPTGRDW